MRAIPTPSKAPPMMLPSWLWNQPSVELDRGLHSEMERRLARTIARLFES